MSDNKLSKIINEVLGSYATDEGINHLEGPNLPSREAVEEIAADLINVVFPGYFEKQEISRSEVDLYVWEKVASAYHSLSYEIAKSIKNESNALEDGAALTAKAVNVTLNFLARLPYIREKLTGDVRAAYEGDPAAKSFDEIIVSYPGLFAIAVYRIAHELYHLEVPLIPRIMTEFAHRSTGVDIHPGAHIGDNFFIDHGTGVVVGETTLIGRNVRIYQGVTLGALSFKKDVQGRIVKQGKRHPTIEDNVVIYAGATILGGETTVGENSVIGGNVWLLESVPRDTTITHQPPKLVYKAAKKADETVYMYHI
ncbi:MAG: serine acetyltransferase [Deltaproteobacteria bacterium]|nr:serine acetyltransferase [Deltaproteobacteria bacterium]